MLIWRQAIKKRKADSEARERLEGRTERKGRSGTYLWTAYALANHVLQ